VHARHLALKGLIVYSNKNHFYSTLALWIESIQNHFWWCVDTATSPEDLVERFLSILNHVVDKHEWIGNRTFKKCEHGPLGKKKWLDPESEAYKVLRAKLKNALVTKDLLQIGRSVHTTRLEVLIQNTYKLYYNIIAIIIPYRTKVKKFFKDDENIFACEAKKSFNLQSGQNLLRLDENFVPYCFGR